MRYFFMDASAWAKYYYAPERGSDVVIYLMDALPRPRHIVITTTAVAETVAVLNRKRNSMLMSHADYLRALESIVVVASQCMPCRVYDNDPMDAVYLIGQHNINSSDALILYKALQFRILLRRAGRPDLAFVTSDKRLLRAATAEGLATLDPEAASLRQVTALLK